MPTMATTDVRGMAGGWRCRWNALNKKAETRTPAVFLVDRLLVSAEKRA